MAWTTLLTLFYPYRPTLSLIQTQQVPSYFRALTRTVSSAQEVLGPCLLGFQTIAYMSQPEGTFSYLPV